LNIMKSITVVGLALCLSMGSVALAESSVTLNKVHLCCDACVKGAQRAVKDVQGLTLKADKDAETVTLTAADDATLRKGVDALSNGGYFGKSEKGGVGPMVKSGAQNKTVDSLAVGGVHLCCGSCVKAIDRAVKETPGATGHTAKKNATAFVVNGKFNDQKFFEALQAQGLSGKVTTMAEVEKAQSAAPAKSDH
jgi:copper chaperone CopZ